MADTTNVQGLERSIELGIRIRLPRDCAGRISALIAERIRSSHEVGVRLAGIDTHGDSSEWILAISMGSITDIRTASPVSVAALAFVHSLVHEMKQYDAALVQLPDPESHSAARARNAIRSARVETILTPSRDVMELSKAC